MTREEVLDLLMPLPDDAVLGLTIYGETRGEPIEGQIAVGCCIRNRVHDAAKRWGTTYKAVCLQKAQFSCWAPDGGAANHQTVVDAAKILLEKKPIPPLLEQASWVTAGLTRNAVQDTTHGANHYMVATLMPRPAWARGQTPVCQRGGHAFYKL